MTDLALPAGALASVLGVIWYLGGGSFGRAQTQAWIDRLARMPRLHAWLNRHHGKFRAAAHYIEFGGLFLALYWLCGTLRGIGMAWEPVQAAALGVLSAVAAWLDELHQLRSGTRQFRREDFLHSCCGVSIAAAIVRYADILGA